MVIKTPIHMVNKRHITVVILSMLLTLITVLLVACSNNTGATTSPAAASVDAPEMPQQGARIEPPRALKDFTLTSNTGTPLSLSDLRGKLVLLYFGYTFCPDICPTTLADFVHVKRNLGEEADQVAFVMISVDGERDTPEVLARYMQAFDPDFIGLQGDAATLRQIGSDYGLYYKKNAVEDTSAGYLVDHTAASYLIDSEGRLAMIYPYGMPSDVISADIREMLQEN